MSGGLRLSGIFLLPFELVQVDEIVRSISETV